MKGIEIRDAVHAENDSLANKGDDALHLAILAGEKTVDQGDICDASSVSQKAVPLRKSSRTT